MNTAHRKQLASVKLTHAGDHQAFIVARANAHTEAADATAFCYSQIAEALTFAQMEIAHERIFASLEVESEVKFARRQALDTKDLLPETPATYIQGNPFWGRGLAGVIIHAISSSDSRIDSWTIRDGSEPFGRGWKANGSTYLVLQNIHGSTSDSLALNTKAQQTKQMIERAGRILEQQGSSFRDVVRTWFYLSDITDWYADFNVARDAKYRELEILGVPNRKNALIPASTGIGGRNLNGSTCVCDLLAVACGSADQPIIQELNNPRQLIPLRYGSSFSRAVLIRDRDIDTIQVSGTAAIDESGKSLYPDDIRGQITNTFDNLEALIAQAGARLRDIAAATVFVKRPNDAAIFWQMISDRACGDLPVVCLVADVCRDELLFEIDAEVALRSPSAMAIDT